MPTINRRATFVAPIRRTLLTLALSTALPASATSFVYQGYLDDFGRPASGVYDVRLSAYSAEELGAALAAPITFEDVEVHEGRFRLEFDLPRAPSGEVWLEVGVRDAADVGGFSAVPARLQAVATAKIGTCWSSTGDVGTNPAVNYLGTSDAQPLVLRTAGAPSLRIEPSAFLDAGLPNTVNVIAGSVANSAAAGVRGATISGGGLPSGDSDPEYITENPNRVTDSFGSVGGGFANTAGNGLTSTTDAGLATVAGGWKNVASGLLSTVAGGEGNTAASVNSVVSGGQGNRALSNHATAAGGVGNTASGPVSVVAGGESSTASGANSFVAGGSLNCAGGQYAWAGGRAAKVRPGSASGIAGDGCNGVPASGDVDGDNGTFVWADSQGTTLTSTGPNQFLVRASGGMAINSNAPVAGAALSVNGPVAVTAQGALSFGTQTRQMVNLWGPSVYGIGVQNGTQYFRTDTLANMGSFVWYGGGAHSDAQFNTGGGAFLAALTPSSVASTPNPIGTMRAATFVNTSDRAMKTSFSAIDIGDVLSKVLAMPVAEWAYKHAPEHRHIGPVAQDFFDAFGLGSDDKSIATIDADGVALAAIQGLNEKLESANAELREVNATLQARLSAVERRLAAMPSR